MVGDFATIQLRFDRGPLSAGRARRAVQDCLNRETPPQAMKNAVLLTSELVTNAVTHARSGGEMVAYYDQLGKRVRIEVRDHSPVLPQIHERLMARRVGGFGLRLVETLATSWGTTATATGKTVWFELEW